MTITAFPSLLLMLFAYLLGSIPSALLLGKVFKEIDIRKHGSGNVGATNASRILGKRLGFVTLVMDVLKGAIPVYLSIKFGVRYFDILLNVPGLTSVLVGLCAILGHSFSIFLGFKGGKSVATSFGVFLVLTFKIIPFLIIIFVLTVLITKYVSVGSIVAAIMLPILIWFVYGNLIYTVFGLAIGILIIVRHQSNIKRLINKTEHKNIR